MKASIILLFSALCSIQFQSCQSKRASQKSLNDSETDIYYSETHRPQFHFSPDSMWMNDPNGMVYDQGEYHLFYQFYPGANVWGPMHWGHAVSTDLVHWQHLPIALYPDKHGYIFSGSAVADINNTSGLGTPKAYPLVAIFTYHDTTGEKAGRNDFQTQGLAYSTDQGRSWTKYEGNPVIKNPGVRDFRDPKVFWHEESKQWVMIFASGDRVRIYNSPDLKDWIMTSEFGSDQGSHGGVWECPDLFELPVDDEDENKWMMIISLGNGGPNGGSGTQYFVGSFDGKTFTNENPAEKVLWLDYGRDNYAGVSWSNIKEEDGRRIFLGWMSNWQYATRVPTERWRSAMTLPRSFSFTRTPEGIRLVANPIRELQNLRKESFEVSNVNIRDSLVLLANSEINAALLEVVLEVEWKQNQTPIFFALELSNSRNEHIHVGYKTETHEYFIDRKNSGITNFEESFAGIHTAPSFAQENTRKLHLFFDLSSVELFADDGLVQMTDIFFPNQDYTELKLIVDQGEVEVKSGKIYALQSVWQEM